MFCVVLRLRQTNVRHVRVESLERLIESRFEVTGECISIQVIGRWENH